MGLLVTASIWALFVGMTLWFPARRGPLGFAVFVLTMSINEIPLILLLVFLASVILSLADVAGEEVLLVDAALGVSLLVVLGLVVLQVRARSAAPALEAALDAVPGAVRPAFPAPHAPLHVRLGEHWLRGILLPFQRHSAAVERTRNVPYAEGNRSHRLDIYRPKDRPTRAHPPAGRPVLIHLHGGGFTHGGKSREGIAMLNRLAGHGWICLSADYRLRSDGAFPKSLTDAKRVIAWARAHAAELGADPGQIFLAGASAGGHLAISAALSPRDPRFQPGFENADTSVAGAVALYGYLGPRTGDPASSPAELARADAPPLMIVHGSRDTAVPPAGPRRVVALLRAASSSPVVYAELPHTQHSFDFFASVRARIAADAVELFLDRVRSGEPMN